jgi:hypothetical protein
MSKIFSKVHLKLKNILKNYMQSMTGETLNDETFINDKKKEIMNIIENNPKWGDSSKMSYYYMISRYLDIKNNEDPLIKIYAQKGYDIQSKIELQNGENKLDEKELENVKPYEYFYKILYNLNDEGDTLKSNYERLLLSLLILQPPLRTDFYTTATFITTLKENDKINNFILIENDKVYYIVNNDKASNYPAYKNKDELSKILIESEELTKYIIDSYTRYPRHFIFENPNTKKSYDEQALLRKLRSITKINLINFQMMRSIYVSWFHKQNKTYNQKKKLSHQMRHSVNTAMKNYNKVETKEEQDQKEEPEPELEKVKKELKEVKAHCKDAFKPTDKLYIKRRADILYRYNSKGVQSTYKTMDKYDIKYNEEKKIYF